MKLGKNKAFERFVWLYSQTTKSVAMKAGHPNQDNQASNYAYQRGRQGVRGRWEKTWGHWWREANTGGRTQDGIT